MSNNLFQLDFTNKEHLKLLKEYEKEHKKIILEDQSNENEFNIYLFTKKEGRICEMCILHGQKDIKICTVTFECDSRKIIVPATEYALNFLNMEEVFIKVECDDKLTKKILEKNEYECLGEEKGSIIYLLEKPELLTKHINK